MKKRLSALLLALVMLVTLLPTTVLATGWEGDWNDRPGDNSDYFGWNIASSITDSGSAVRYEDKDAYDAVAADVSVYVGQLEGEVTEETVAAAAENGTLVEMPIGGYYGNAGRQSHVPALSDWTIDEINEKGLIVVARNGLTFERSSICCNDDYGFNCQTAAAGNAGDFNDAIISGTTRILVVTPEMLAAEGVYHEGRGHAWLMLSTAVYVEPTVSYTVHYYIENTTIPVRPDKVVTGQTLGTTVTETAENVREFVALAPTTQELTLTEDGMEIIFYYTLPEPDIKLEKGEHYNYIVGYSDGTVRPEGQITRAEVAAIFFRLMTEESRNEMMTTENPFTDVNEGQWFNVAVSTLTNAGIFNGYPDGTFKPTRSITRAELAKVIALFAELQEGTVRFRDINGHWAQAYIELAAGNGWIYGYPDGTFRPDNNLNRAETITMINRVLDRDVRHEENLLDGMVTFSDNMDTHVWYYYHIQEATNYHTYTRLEPYSTEEKWVELVDNIDWTIYQY